MARTLKEEEEKNPKWMFCWPCSGRQYAAQVSQALCGHEAPYPNMTWCAECAKKNKSCMACGDKVLPLLKRLDTI